MGTVYDKLVDQAEAMVNIINKKYIAGNRMAYLALLSGVGSCRIESYPGAGHNYQAVVDAIHNCYARDNTSGIDTGYRDGLYAMINVAGSFPALQTLMNILFYQLKKEKEGKAQFKIDIQEVIDKVNMLISENCASYEKENLILEALIQDSIQQKRYLMTLLYHGTGGMIYYQPNQDALSDKTYHNILQYNQELAFYYNQKTQYQLLDESSLTGYGDYLRKTYPGVLLIELSKMGGNPLGPYGDKENIERVYEENINALDSIFIHQKRKIKKPYRK